MPTEPHPDPQHYLLRTIRQSQATAIDTLRAWTTLTEQLTRTLRLPLPELDLPGMVDRTFDLAEQTLTAHHQLARTLAGVTTHQLDTATETADTAVAAAARTDDQRLRRAEQKQPDPEPPQPPTQDPPKAASPNHNRRPDGRTYEERTLEELRERAAELELEGRSTMTKDELITALRHHRRRRSANTDTPRQERTPDRRTYEERSIEELRERARQLQLEGRSTMTKDDLITALRQHTK